MPELHLTLVVLIPFCVPWCCPRRVCVTSDTGSGLRTSCIPRWRTVARRACTPRSPARCSGSWAAPSTAPPSENLPCKHIMINDEMLHFFHCNLLVSWTLACHNWTSLIYQWFSSIHVNLSYFINHKPQDLEGQERWLSMTKGSF